MSPESRRQYNGRFVSPMHLRIADPKLYIMITGSPNEYILRYCTAYGSTSSGVFISSSSGFDIASPMKRRTMPLSSAIVIAVWTARFAFSLLPWPIYPETMTFAPTEIPTNRFTMRFITELLQPTAAVA